MSWALLYKPNFLFSHAPVPQFSKGKYTDLPHARQTVGGHVQIIYDKVSVWPDCSKLPTEHTWSAGAGSGSTQQAWRQPFMDMIVHVLVLNTAWDIKCTGLL